MYDITYECRYHKDDVFLETDDVTDDIKEYIRTILYREDLLNIFGINHDDDSDIFDTVISELCKKINTCEELKECMRLGASKLMSENEDMGLCILYSYDYMHLTHMCVCYYLERGEIPRNLIDALKKLLH